MKAHFSHKDRASLTLPLTASSLEHSQSVGEQTPTKTTSRSISESYNTSFSTAQPVVNPHSRGSGGTTSRLRAQLSRGQSIRETLSNSTARFFGVPPPIDRQQSFSFGTSHDPRWTLRRLRYMNRRYGGLNEQAKRELDSRVVDDLADLASQLATPSTTALQPVTPISALEPSAYTPGLVSRSVSTESRASRIIPPFERRDSVAKMAWDSLSSIVQRGTFRSSARRQVAPPPGILRGRSPSSSFSPFTVQPVGGGPRLLNADASAVVQDAAVSVPQMTTVEEVDEESGRITSATAQDVTSEITKTERRDEHPASPKSATSADSIQDEVFFDVSPIGQQPMRPTLLVLPGQTNFAVISPSAGPFIDHRPAYSGGPRLNVPYSPHRRISPHLPRVSPTSCRPTFQSSVQLRHRMRPERLHRQESFDAGVQTPVGLQEGSLQAEAQRPVRSQEGSFQAGPQTPVGSQEDTLRGNRIVTRVGDVRRKKYEIAGELLSRARITKPPRGSSILESIHARLQARPGKVVVPRRGRLFVGFLRKFLNPKFTRTVDQKSFEQLDSFNDYRPYFTYWVTCVQVLVSIITIFTYGFGPIGFGRVERTADVLHSTVTLKHVSVYELENLWLGPKFSDLVHLGATFAPCMRHDPRIYAQIEADRALENETGCCVYNDGTGCFQTGEDTCPKVIASLVKWKVGATGPDGRTSGAVCGQDPRYCKDPPSVDPFEWPDDITKWPQCHRSASQIPENEKHLQCEITGRPCCIQLHGQCRITTRDYCDFVQGYFHENATLCSQVSCLGEVCGMLPFMHKDQPDQFYRLFIPIFLHAGIIHCAITVVVQWYYMRDLEKLIGWARMAIVYMGAGIGGSLASAIFLPYRPEVGPAGSHIGIFAAMYTDIIYNWKLIQRPWHALRELMMFTTVLFLVGLLPWIDNWAHLFGFIFGLLISLATFPYIQSADNDRTWRLVVVCACLAIAFALFILLLVVFYLRSDFECPFCEYFNCIPFTDHLCDNQGLRLQSWLPI